MARSFVRHLRFVALLLDAVVVDIDVQSVLCMSTEYARTLLVVLRFSDWAHVGHTTLEVLIVFLIHFYSINNRFASQIQTE